MKTWLNWARTEGMWLLMVVTVAAVIRLFNLGGLPYGFHNDEVMNGYVGRFIFENGRDLYGNRWPVLFFNNFGDYPNVVPMYLSGLFTYVFGVNEFAVRFPIALAGILTVGLVYVILRWLFSARWVAVVAALFLAVLPWHVVLSRATAEGITATFVYLLGFFLIIRAVAARQKLGLIVGSMCLLLTYLLYPGFRILSPLGFLPVILLATTKQWRLMTGVVLAVLLVVTGQIGQTTWGKGRFEQTSVFTHNNVIGGKALQYATGLGDNKILQAKIFHNKYVLAGQEIARQYASYFSPQFLLGSEGKPERYAVPEQGLLTFTMVLMVALVIGWQFVQPLSALELEKVFRTDRARYFVVFCWLTFIAPVSAALTLEDVPNVHRSVQLGVCMVIVFAGALAILHARLKKSVARIAVSGLLMCGMAVETIFFWHYFAALSPMTSTLDRAEEQRTAARWLVNNQANFDYVFTSSGGALPVHYLFQKQQFGAELVGKFKAGLRLEQADKIVFLPEDCPLMPASDDRLLAERVAILVRASCDQPTWLHKSTMLPFIDQKAAYFVYTPDRELLMQQRLPSTK